MYLMTYRGTKNIVGLFAVTLSFHYWQGGWRFLFKCVRTVSLIIYRIVTFVPIKINHHLRNISLLDTLCVLATSYYILH